MRRLLAFAFLFLFIPAALAALSFPALTGRVVDDAHILPGGTIASLDSMLAQHEQATTNQIVVVTIPSLQGTSIEDYGYQLGRAWHIGQKDKNNGALLIVAPNERKVRIEVGYGLEDKLTDAQCTNIIDVVILPKFRANDMPQGIVDGTTAILGILTGHPVAGAVVADPDVESNFDQHTVHLSQQELAHLTNSQTSFLWLGVGAFIIGVVAFIMTLSDMRRGISTNFLLDFIANYFMIIFMFLSNGRGGSGSGGGGSSFSGGGGSFGGGGASGSW